MLGHGSRLHVKDFAGNHDTIWRPRRYLKRIFCPCWIVLTAIRVESLQSDFVNRLSEAVSIASVSADAAYRPQTHQMGHWLADKLKLAGVR